MTDWYQQSGDAGDVILSTRIRISRNLSEHLFPGSMGHQEEQKVKEKLVNAFTELEKDDFRIFSLDELKPHQRRLLLEKKLISQDFSLNKEKVLILNKDQNFSGMINGKDHLRMVRYQGGLSLDEILETMIGLDGELEEILDFAASFDIGYLGPNLRNLGTGMKMSLMIHLPCLVETGLIEKALKTILHAGFQVKGFIGEEDESLGQFYLIANQNTLGTSEKEIQEKLEGMARQVLTYERMARNDLVSKKKIEIEDRVYRAEGLLNSCRILSRNDGVEMIASLRLGTVLEMVPYKLERLNALLILGQASHIHDRLRSRGEESDALSVEIERASFFRDFISQTDTHGGNT